MDVRGFPLAEAKKKIWGYYSSKMVGILNYYKYDLKREKMVKEKWNGLSVCCPLFKKTPVSFLKCLGGLVYKHAE